MAFAQVPAGGETLAEAAASYMVVLREAVKDLLHSRHDPSHPTVERQSNFPLVIFINHPS